MIKVNFKEVKLFDIEGKIIPYEKNEIHKRIAELLYFNSKKLDLVQVGMEINKGIEIESREDELNEIKEMVVGAHNFPAHIKKSIKEFIESKIKKWV